MSQFLHDYEEASPDPRRDPARTVAAEGGSDDGAASPDPVHAPERMPGGGDPIEGVIVRALDRLDARRRRVRDPATGRWTVGNGAALKTGLPDSFWTDLEPARAEIVGRVRVQLGLDDAHDGRETALGVVDALAEARLIRRSEFLQLTRLNDAAGVARSAKGRLRQQERRRAHLTAWAMAFDRELRAAGVLGLERKARAVSLSDWVAERQPAAEENTP
ncbi:MAG: hypothetical protein ACREF4_10730 [Gammaproteobacteria bacterium]